MGQSKFFKKYHRVLFPSLHAIWLQRGLILIISDAAAISFCSLVACYLQFHVETKTEPVFFQSILPDYMKLSLFLSLFWIIHICKNQGYERNLLNLGMGSAFVKIRPVVKGGFYSLYIVLVYSLLFQGATPVPIFSCLIILLFSVISMLFSRLVFFRFVDDYLEERGFFTHKIVIVGFNDVCNVLIENIKKIRGSIRIVGYVGGHEYRYELIEKGIPYLGHVHDIESIHEKIRFNTLLIANSENELGSCIPEVGKVDIMAIINFCEMKEMEFYMISGTYSVEIGTEDVGSFLGRPMAVLKDASFNPVHSVIKRIMDFSISLTGLLLGLPLWIILAALIKASGRGPILFTQIRAGVNGKPFKMYKFRSMVEDAEERLKDIVDINELDEPVFKIKNDPRVTAVGRFLRRTSLDEIPQLINVLIGEMSLVGPRPEELRIVDKYDAYQRRRLKAKPGITGYQQIINRGEPDLSRRVKYDLIYLKKQSIVMDLYILFMTPAVVVFGKGDIH